MLNIANLDSAIAIGGFAATALGVLWNIAETKRKLENQFQTSI